MYISKLSGQSIKGGNFSVALTLANVIIGDNFRGKTRILEAAQILLLGRVPALGKEPRETFNALASGTRMIVEGDIVDNGTTWHARREFWLEGNSVKVKSDVPKFLEDFPPVMLHANVYFALGETDRVRYVREHCPEPAGFSPNEIAARVGKTGFSIHGLLGDFELTGREYIEEITDRVVAYGKRQKDEADTMERTIRGLSGMRAGELPPETTLLSALDARAEVERKIVDLAEAKGLKIGDYTRMISDRLRRAEISRERKFAEKDRQALANINEKIRLLEAELVEAKKLAPDPLLIGELEGRKDRARDEVVKLRRDQEDLDHDRALRERELAEIDARDTCPYCGATGEDWKKIKAAELATVIDDAKRKVDDLVNPRLDADKNCEELQRRIIEARTATTRVQTVEDQLAHTQRLAAPVATRLARITAQDEELARLTPDDPALESSVDEIQGKLNVLNDEKGRIDAQITGAQNRKHELKRLADAERSRDVSRENQELARLAVIELKAIKAEMAAASFRPLLDTANAFFPGILQTPLEYNLEKSEIGTRRDGLWVSHRTFSGVEKALTYAAIQAALTTRAPIKLMLIDELGRLTAENAARFSVAVADALTAGTLDQFIGVDPERGPLYFGAYNSEDPEKSSFTVIEIQ